MKNLIIWDLDDTLIDTSDLYYRVRKEFLEFIALEIGVGDSLEEIFENIDTKNTVKYGHLPERYEYTMLEMYSLYIKTPVDAQLEKIKGIAQRLLREVPPPIAGAYEVLEWCKSYFDQALITRGVEVVQLNKIKALNFEKYFTTGIRVVPAKDSNVFSSFIHDCGFKTSDVIIIGDSIKGEVNPGMQIGAKCIYYNYSHHTYHWLQEHTAKATAKSYFQVSRLLEAKDILERFIRNDHYHH